MIVERFGGDFLLFSKREVLRMARVGARSADDLATIDRVEKALKRTSRILQALTDEEYATAYERAGL